MTRSISLVVLCLYLLGGAASAQTPAPQPTTVDASRGGVTIQSGVNSLMIGARGQFRWTMDDREQFDADTTGSGAGVEDDPFSQFDVPRLRLTLSGGVFRPWLRYLFQVELSRTGGEGGSRIKDALIEIRPPDRPYRLQLGQFKAPFGLQQLTSSGRLQFVDRAITDAKFNPGRDMGVMFAGTAARRIGYDLGVFNGSGESIRQNTRSPLWIGRVYFEPFGAYTLAEGASDAPGRPVLHVGGAVRGGKAIRGRTPEGVVEEADNQLAYDLELAFKAARLFVTAEHFWMIDEQENPVPARAIDSRGFHAQAGYMLLPRRLEAGVLYAQVDGDTNVADSGVTEARAVVGYYWESHNLKLQGDVGQVQYESAFSAMSGRARQGLPAPGRRLVSGQDLSDTQLRVQMTVAF